MSRMISPNNVKLVKKLIATSAFFFSRPCVVDGKVRALDAVSFADEFASIKVEDCERCYRAHAGAERGSEGKLQASVRHVLGHFFVFSDAS